MISLRITDLNTDNRHLMILQAVMLDIRPRSRMWMEAAVRVVALSRKCPGESSGNHNDHFRPILNRVSPECKCVRCEVPEDKARGNCYGNAMFS
jgi:hypothetical protein